MEPSFKDCTKIQANVVLESGVVVCFLVGFHTWKYGEMGLGEKESGMKGGVVYDQSGL